MAKRKSPTRKPFEQLTITDNYMFQAVMRDTKRVKPLLEMVLGKKIQKLEFVEIEKTVENGYDSRGIRMDIYVEKAISSSSPHMIHLEEDGTFILSICFANGIQVYQ